MPGAVFHELEALWRARECADEVFGTLVNDYLARGGKARGIRAGQAYVDVGTLHGYRTAMTLLADMAAAGHQAMAPALDLPIRSEARCEALS
jgi:hypothetical protein